MSVLNVVPQTILRPVIIPATLIRPIKTLIYKNEKEIVNKIMTAPRTPASYAQIIAKNSSDLDKSQ